MPQHSTVFGVTANEPLDDPLLAEALSAAKELEKPKEGKGSAFVPAERGVAVLEHRRAMTVEVAWKKVTISPSSLSSILKTLEFHHPQLSTGDVDRLLGKMPTPQEAAAIAMQARRPEELRRLEQHVLPLCQVPDAERRLGLVHTARTHSSRFRSLIEHCECSERAAKEVKECEALHRVLGTALKIANLINHGSSDGAQSFPVSSFSAFANFKVGNVSSLFFLCSKLCTPGFLDSLEADLTQVFRAAKGSTSAFKEEAQALAGARADARAQAAAEEEPRAKAQAEALLFKLNGEQAQLERASEAAKSAVHEAQLFLCERADSPMTSEEFFGHVVQLVKHLQQVTESADYQQHQEKQRASGRLSTGSDTPSRVRDSLAGATPPPGGALPSFTGAAIFREDSRSPAPTPSPPPPSAAMLAARSPEEAAVAAAAGELSAEDLPACPRRLPRRSQPKNVSWFADGFNVHGAVVALNSALAVEGEEE